MQAEVKRNRTAVVQVKSARLESRLKEIPYQFAGEAVTIHQAFLIWLPFKLPGSEVSY